jgi:phosphatidate cytidylyltransferase
MSCPQDEIVFQPFVYPTCEKSRIFLPKTYTMPSFFSYIGLVTMSLSPFQLNSIVFTAFASFIAPFGGFFASGFKRAFKIKVRLI